MHRSRSTVLLALLCATGAQAAPLSTHAVVPEDGPFFEPLQQRDDLDIDTQLNFEFDLLGSFQAAQIQQVRITYSDTLGNPHGDEVIVGVEDLRAHYLHDGDRNGFGPDRDGFLGLPLGEPYEWTDVFTYGSMYAAGNGTLLAGTNATPVMFASRHDGDGRELVWFTPVPFPNAAGSAATSTMRTGDQLLVAGSVTPFRKDGLPAKQRQYAFAQLERYGDDEGNLVPAFSGDGMQAIAVEGCDASVEDLVPATDRAGDPAYVGIGDLDCAKGGEVGLVKLLGDGSLDGGFGKNGLVQAASALGSVEVRGGVHDPATDAIYAVGQLDGQMMIARFRSDGELDLGWGTDGFYVIPTPDLRDAIAHEAQVLSDGRIAVVGDGIVDLGDRAMVVAMVTTSSTLDPGFDGNGYRIHDFGLPAYGRDLVVDEGADRIWASGWVEDGRVDGFAVGATTTFGDLPDFAGDGTLVVTFPNETPGNQSYGMALQAPDNSAEDRYGLPTARDFLTLVGTAGSQPGAIQIDSTDGTMDDNAVLTRFSRRVLFWPDTGVIPGEATHTGTEHQWDALPYKAHIEATLVDPFTGALLPSWTETVMPKPYEQELNLWFPAMTADLDVNTQEHWYIGQAHHVANNHRGQSTFHAGDDRHYSGQRFAYDMTVTRWTGSGWVGTHEGAPEDEEDQLNSDMLVYGKPIHPMQEGWVVWCTDGVAENSAPGIKDGGSEGVCTLVDADEDGEEDDCLYFGGGNEVRVQHPDGSVTMYAHMQPGTLPQCPHGAGRGPVEPPVYVTRDDVLGLSGNSGSSTGPHLHTEVHRPWDPDLEDYTKADGRPLLWENVRSIRTSDAPDDFVGPWDRRAPHGGSVLDLVDDFWSPPETECDLVGANTPGPDGDFSVDHYCDDSDGEAVCVARDNGSWGECVTCAEDPTAPGCLCQEDEECGQGMTCYGTDAGGSARGRCYEELPWWQCSVVCEDVLGDGATCMNEHYTGVGHCLDFLTEPWLADSCQQIEELPALFGECQAECDEEQSCTDLGYPDWFVCGTDIEMQPLCLDPFRL